MVLLTFNIINNRPETTSGQLLSDHELLEITIKNTNAILRNLEAYDVKSTFFVEIGLVSRLQQLLKKIVSKGHEVALYNDGSDEKTVSETKTFAQNFLEKPIRGIRRKKVKLTTEQLKMLGFIYISDIENANILFPFKRLERSTEITEELGLSIIPESISPYSQIPYNDFVFQAVPVQYFMSMVTETLKNDEFVMIYLNTWQFTDRKEYRLKLPFYRRFNSGKKMEDKLEEFLGWLNESDFATARVKDYIF